MKSSPQLTFPSQTLEHTPGFSFEDQIENALSERPVQSPDRALKGKIQSLQEASTGKGVSTDKTPVYFFHMARNTQLLVTLYTFSIVFRVIFFLNHLKI